MTAPPPAKRLAFRCVLGIAMGFAIPMALACQPNPHLVIDDPCVAPPVLPETGSAKLAYAELRGTTGLSAIVLENGTKIALDFASGEIVITLIDGQRFRVHRDQLPEAARAQFITLAQRVSFSPDFSFEAGIGAPPASVTSPPRVPFWGYPLRSSLFGLGGPIAMKSGGDGSPCMNNNRPCPVLDTVEVRPQPEIGSGGGGGGGAIDLMWFRSTERPTNSSAFVQFDALLLEYDRMKWERWRQGRCQDAIRGTGYLATTAVALAHSCGQAYTATKPGLLICAAASIGYLLATDNYLNSSQDCRSSYPGPLGWP